jgi:ComF family protein
MRIALAGATAYGLYRGRLRDCILDLKFKRQRWLSRTLGALAAGAVRGKWPELEFDAVAAAALHRGRRLSRGFDQARELARHTARSLEMPFASRIVVRTRATESQVGLTRTARIRNVRGAFKARTMRRLERVLLVDDTMTTGATLSEAARALKRKGAREVYAVVVARAGFGVDGRIVPEENISEGKRI